MAIVTTGHLDDSEETKNRLFQKINNYLEIFNSEDFEDQHGQIPYDQLTITVLHSPQPHPTIFGLIEVLSSQLSPHGIKIFLKQR